MILFLKKLFVWFKPFYKKIVADNIFAIAGQSAFFLVLSSVPLMMFGVSVLQSLHIPVQVIENAVGSVFSQHVANKVAVYLGSMYQSTVGISIITIIVALWSAAQGMHAVTNGLNRVHNTYENRNWLVLRLRAMLYTVIVFVIALLTMLAVVFGSSIHQMVAPQLRYLPEIVNLLYHGRFVIIFLYLVLMFALAYRILPNLPREERRSYGFLCQLPGALFCAVSWFVLALALGIYVEKFNGYSIYGNLSKVAAVLIWLYFCMVCLMLGAEFNFSCRKRFDYNIRKRMKKRAAKTAKQKK